jgi:hypothetical protein
MISNPLKEAFEKAGVKGFVFNKFRDSGDFA